MIANLIVVFVPEVNNFRIKNNQRFIDIKQRSSYKQQRELQAC